MISADKPAYEIEASQIPVRRISVPAAMNEATSPVKEEAYHIIACMYAKGFNFDFIRYTILPFCINEKTRYDGDIREAVKEWFNDSVTAEKKYGHIKSWDVSRVTNMDGLFKHKKFNEDISSWDVSNVTSMNMMFMYSRFNQDIGRWNVSKVTNMRYMFRGNWIFNHNINAWNVSRVTNMDWMIAECHAFNQDISKWDVSNVKTRKYFCFGASSFQKDVHEPKFPHENPLLTHSCI